MLSGSPWHILHSMSLSGERKPPRRIDWRRMATYFRPYWRQEALIVAAILVASVLGQLPPLFTKWIIDGAIAHKSLHLLFMLVGGMVASALIASAIGAWQGYLNSYVGEGIMRDMRDALVRHLHGMSLSFFTATKTGEIMNRVSSDVDAIDNVVTGTFVTIVTNVAIIATTLLAIFLLDWRLALLSLLVVPLMVIPLGPVGRTMFNVRKRTREQRDHIESLLQETLSLSGVTLMKSFVRERQEAARFHEAGTDLMHWRSASHSWAGGSSRSSERWSSSGPRSCGSLAVGLRSRKASGSARSSHLWRTWRACTDPRPRSSACKCSS